MSRRPWERYIALFVIGCLLGGASILFMHGREMEEMMLVKQSLELQNKKLYEENLSLKKNQHVSRRKQETVIEEIRVTVLDPKPHPTIEVQVVDKMEEDLESLKGKKVEQVAEVHQVLHEMLRRREYVLSDGSMSEVRIKTVVISRTLHLFVTAEVKTEEVWQAVARNFLTFHSYIQSEKIIKL
ncbi:hypothetical protein T458_19510 [Brevibacillus panacihumi W25]|uniref:Sporulation membrane protein YtrI C-terminal domain-containing protein n=2 Tax=Brevibacillus panacihumi TaxID=497735 RepID=V6M385_9BACL|nr:hypothetical protein [Brevibacillus panacihumi]EST53076.1 hypothetical protein T458_19510 [Brevibacillus panacihumi W25]RNB75628.1 hypothetical protein EDM58_18280 [Brevibacillus panacihumi]